jgi:hypothetical protein
MKITIETDLELEDLKNCYRNYYGYPKSHKVTKADLSAFIGNLANADLQDLDFEPEQD